MSVVTLKDFRMSDVASDLEPVSHLTSEAVPFDLASIPSNERAMKEREAQMMWLHTAGFLLRHDDKELTEKVRRHPETFMEILEEIGHLCEWYEDHLKLIQSVECRLIVALERCCHGPRDGGEPVPESIVA